MQDLMERANADPFARRWAMGCSFDMVLDVGEGEELVCVRGGQVTEIRKLDNRLVSWDFAIRGSAEAWAKHWAPTPEPTYHDIIAMRTAGHITIEGNLQPFFANILYVKRLLELPREKADAA